MSSYTRPEQFTSLALTDAKRFLHDKRVSFPDKKYEVAYRLVRGRSLYAIVYPIISQSYASETANPAFSPPVPVGEYKMKTKGDPTGNAIVTATYKVLDDLVKNQRTIRLSPAK